MIEAVFISDLHLNPAEPEINHRFDEFVQWAATSTESIYILGDFFHVWPGDDGLDDWSLAIAKQLRTLSDKGIRIYYMHGNRDFLLGQRFAELAGWSMMEAPTIISCGEAQILLTHGDEYCTKDRSHQRFRRLTRNKWFKRLFLALPYVIRLKLVQGVRRHSQSNRRKSEEMMDVVIPVFLKQMQVLKVRYLIHGHTHKPGLNVYEMNGEAYKRYVLSDWDDKPQILCYDKTNGLYYIQI